MGSDAHHRVAIVGQEVISIHAPRMGSDHLLAQQVDDRLISIHAPRMGSDPSSTRAYSTSTNFNPRSPDGERLPASEPIMPLSAFQSTLPGWGATGPDAVSGHDIEYFNPRSPDGERPCSPQMPRASRRFQSTLPGWGATLCFGMATTLPPNFNPRSPDGERPGHATIPPIRYYFNPRSPDGERLVPRVRRPENGISIHAPRMGSDCPAFVTMRRTLTFQSTLPGWGATAPALVARNSWPDISIHAPRMGSDLVRVEHVRVGFHISIHAPRMGSDECDEGGRRCRIYFNPRSPDGERRADKLQSIRPCAFQSTLPGWGATVSGRIDHVAVDYFNPRSPDGERRTGQQDRHRQTDFNPRSPDGERHGAAGLAHPRTDFNPRSPDGERPVTVPPWPIVPIFQSTLPGWGATVARDAQHARIQISIHAPRMGSDRLVMRRRCSRMHFNPRSPDGERHTRPYVWVSRRIFQSTLPGWGATDTMDLYTNNQERFQSTLPGWGATLRFATAPPL